jgi:hypothetical protein
MIGKIGIDIGGVIIDRARNDDTDTSLFGPNYLNAHAVPYALEAISVINKELFPNETYIISKCGANIERKSREWLKHNGFYEKTGMEEGKVHFCRQRADKAPIAQKIGLTHFIDDKYEVLGYMKDVVANRILFSPDKEEIRMTGPLAGPVIPVFAWADVLGLLRAPL